MLSSTLFFATLITRYFTLRRTPLRHYGRRFSIRFISLRHAAAVAAIRYDTALLQPLIDDIRCLFPDYAPPPRRHRQGNKRRDREYGENENRTE